MVNRELKKAVIGDQLSVICNFQTVKQLLMLFDFYT